MSEPAFEAPIDLAHLARYTGGEKTLNAEILKLFDNQITEMVGQLHNVLKARDATRWREITHTIKGAARGVGAFAMGEAAAAAEPAEPGTEKAEEAVRKLQQEGHAVQLFIAEYIAA